MSNEKELAVNDTLVKDVNLIQLEIKAITRSVDECAKFPKRADAGNPQSHALETFFYAVTVEIMQTQRRLTRLIEEAATRKHHTFQTLLDADRLLAEVRIVMKTMYAQYFQKRIEALTSILDTKIDA